MQNGNSEDWFDKYIILKYTGEYTDLDAQYFVLRLDNACKDKIHLEASKKAILVYAEHLKNNNHLKKLTDSIFKNYSLKNF